MSSSEEILGFAPAAGEESDTRVSPERVGHLLSTLGKAIRAHQIYQPNNPVYQRFVASVQHGFAALWNETASLNLRVEEGGLVWKGQTFPVGEGRDALPFMLYKDGIRFVSFLAGFEEEVGAFLDAVHRARQVEQFGGDDLITMLWEADFSFLTYGYVDQLAEATELPEAGPGLDAPIPVEQLAEEIRSGAITDAAQGAPAPGVPAGLTREDFEATLYFLDDAELTRLQDELHREWERDVKQDVLNALFDRLEDQDPHRQREILTILHQLIPTFLGRGDLANASNVLLELQTMLEEEDVLSAEARTLADQLFEELSTPDILNQLIVAIEQGSIDPDASELGIFLKYMRPQALPILVRATEITTIVGLRERLRTAIEGIARENVDTVLALLHQGEPITTAGAARLLGRLRKTEAAEPLGGLLDHPEPEVRLAAVDALVALKSSATVDALQRALRDGHREVRIAAVRGLGAMRFLPARHRLEQLLQERDVRDADLTEKLAFFEAYASLAGADGVALLDRLLNGRSLLGGRQDPEVRACAARALGRISSPAAAAALRQAADDKEPLVRNAVHGALRHEAP